jgi:HAD superfamily hydrolase (TIGR01509 family)
MLKAVIFDLDGVLVDSHPIHEAAWKALLREEGLNPAAMDPAFLQAGHPRREILRHYLGPLDPGELERLGQRKDELYYVAAKALDAKSGVLRVLRELTAANILCALASSAGRLRTHNSLARFGMTGYFSAIVTGEDVRAPKPAPDIFLLAAQKLAVAPRACVVVEDSVAGVQAAVAAGMTCVGFAPAQRLPELRQSGAQGLVSALPENAVRYFQDVVRRAAPRAVSPARFVAIRERD